MVLATTRADVNGLVKRELDVRKASFAPMETAVELTGMEYGGITPIGLPADWPLFVDDAVGVRPPRGHRQRSAPVEADAARRALASLPGARRADGAGRKQPDG